MAVLASTLLDRVAEIITRYNMIPPASRIGVAVSGGADSVVLLCLLHQLSASLKTELSVLHLNHLLRGAESDADEEFVRNLAGSFGLPYLIERASPAPGNLEQAARNARREFFFRIRKENGLAAVALGHTRGDQAETVFFRFLRGSGSAGLAGMRFQTKDGLIRPLLTFGRQELRAWAASEGISWREDSSNSNLDFSRNRLRTETLPALTRDYNQNLEGVLANAATIAQAEEEYWSGEISALCSRIVERTGLGLQVSSPQLAALHSALQRRLIRHLLSEIRGDLRSIEFQHVEAILALCQSSHGHDRVIVPGVDALRSFELLLLSKPGTLGSQKRHFKVQLTEGAECELPYSGGYLGLASVNSESQIYANFENGEYFPSECTVMDGSALKFGTSGYSLFVRNWEPGDEIQRCGHENAEKLKSLFQEYRILLWERRHWPVVVCGDNIVWVRKFGCAAKFKGTAQSRSLVRLCYRRAAVGDKKVL